MCRMLVIISYICLGLLSICTVAIANPLVEQPSPSLNADIYKIEVVIFEHTESDRFAHEHWPQFVGELNLNKAIDWESLKADSTTLNSEMRILRSSKSERLIKHFAWEQAISNNTKSTPVYVKIGAEPEVQSVFTVKPNKNMFNVKVDLIYNLQDKDKNIAPEVNAIRVTRDVKVKKKELYYLDHPVIGLLLQITPIDKVKQQPVN